jgi:substrate-binding family protein
MLYYPTFYEGLEQSNNVIYTGGRRHPPGVCRRSTLKAKIGCASMSVVLPPFPKGPPVAAPAAA